MQIMDVHLILHCMKTNLVGSPDDLSSANAAARHPDREPVRVVVSAVPVAGAHGVAVSERRPPKITSPDDQGAFQQPRPFKVSQQSCNGPVYFPRHGAVILVALVVAVPTLLTSFFPAGIELHKADSAFYHPPRQQALSAELGRAAG